MNTIEIAGYYVAGTCFGNPVMDLLSTDRELETNQLPDYTYWCEAGENMGETTVRADIESANAYTAMIRFMAETEC